MSGERFPDRVVEAVRRAKILGIRAGSRPHRFIGVWAVVVDRRIFVRSWSASRDGWHGVLAAEPRGALSVGGRELPFRAVRTRSERLKDRVDRAYADKYDTPGAVRYVRDLSRQRSRATTTELAPRRRGTRGRAAGR